MNLRTISDIEKEFDTWRKRFSCECDLEYEKQPQNCCFVEGDAEDLKSFISSSFHELLDQVLPEESNSYIVHEVHGEGGITTTGEKLYWAKVKKGTDPIHQQTLDRMRC